MSENSIPYRYWLRKNNLQIFLNMSFAYYEYTGTLKLRKKHEILPYPYQFWSKEKIVEKG
jgi:hypothetical protein